MHAIRLYSKSGSDDDREVRISKEVRRFLRQHDVSFTEYDIAKHPSLRQQLELRTGGGVTLPVLWMDEEVLQGGEILPALKDELGVKEGAAKKKEDIKSSWKSIKERLGDLIPVRRVESQDPLRDYLEPRNFEVGVTSGLPSMDRATVVEEAVQSMGKGNSFMRLDVESYMHLTPKDKEELSHLAESQGIRWAIHADLTLDLTRSEQDMWEFVSESIDGYTDMADELDALYVNVHPSVSPGPSVQSGLRRSQAQHVGPDGRKIKKFLEESDKAQKWYTKEMTKNVRMDQMRGHFNDKLRGKDPEEIEERAKELQNMSPEELRNEFRKDIQEDVLSQFDNRVNRWTSYMIVAWWMHEKGDGLWRRFCGKKDPVTLFEGDNDDQMDLYDAVAGAYVRGHFNKHMKKIKKNDVLWLIENPDARSNNWAGQRLFTLMTPDRILEVVKNVDSKHLRLCIDWEHIAHQGFDPWEVAEEFPNDIGEYVVNFDVGSHPNINHQHHPVERGDIHLYKLLWEVKKRGMDKAFLLYEWGGGRDPSERWKMSVPALKDMAKMLENEVPPDELPPEFFGLTNEEIELERRIMDRNKFKHMEGTLEFPDLAHGWFGEEMIKKRKLDTWAREEYQ